MSFKKLVLSSGLDSRAARELLDASAVGDRIAVRTRPNKGHQPKKERNKKGKSR